MTLHPHYDPGPSPGALALYRCIRRNGGALRIATLLRRATNDADRAALCDAIGELTERYWVRITWRKTGPDASPDNPRPLEDIDHLRTTRFGRRKYRTWSWG